MNEKEKRNVTVLIEGNKTKEGRLKIEKITELKRKAEDDKLNAIVTAGLAGFDALVSVVGNNYIDNVVISSSVSSIFALLAIVNAGRSVFSAIQMIKNKKSAHDLEEEILNPFTIKN